MAKLDIVIPTYNRPDCIKYILKKTEKYFYDGYDFVISIFDSSTNDETKELVLPYVGDKISYHRIESSINVDEKTLISIKKSVADYVMLSGDGSCPEVDNIFADIDFDNNDAYEMFVLYDSKWDRQRKFFKKLKKYESDDKSAFFALHFWEITLYGGSICKRELISRININKMVEVYNGSGFIYPCSVACVANGPFKCVMGEYLRPIKYKGTSGWVINKDGTKIWTHNYYNAVTTLDNVLTPEAIKAIVKNTGKYTWFLTARGLMSWRTTNNYNFGFYKKYKFYIKQCKACPMFVAYLIAIIPNFVFKLIKKIYGIFKKQEANEL